MIRLDVHVRSKYIQQLKNTFSQKYPNWGEMEEICEKFCTYFLFYTTD